MANNISIQEAFYKLKEKFAKLKYVNNPPELNDLGERRFGYSKSDKIYG